MGNRKGKILVVDDPDILSGVKKRLTWFGYETITSERGEPVLDIIEIELPDLILLDIELPDISGIEVLWSKYSSDLLITLTPAHRNRSQNRFFT